MAGFDFEVALQVSTFLFMVWFVSRIFAYFKLPPILGQLLVGIFLGPNGIDMVPYASNGLCWERLIDPKPEPHPPPSPPLYPPPAMGGRMLSDTFGAFDDADLTLGRMLAASSGSGSGGDEWKCTWVQWDRWEPHTHLTNIWTFIGNVGVTLMIMESGMHIHFDKVKAVGKKAFVVAVFGTLGPIIVGTAVVGALMQGVDSTMAFYPWGFAAGCAFAPTSVGISIRLLDESKMLNSIAGQTTLIAAFIDDVFSLVTLVILQTLAKGDITALSIIIPLVCSFAFLAIGVLLAIYVFPKLGPILDKIPLAKNTSMQLRDEVHLGLMFFSLFFFGWVSSVTEVGGQPFIGSHLLGAFVAGMIWVNVPRSHNIWERQMKRIVKWMMRLFFSASVGFAVPVTKMFSIESIWRGAVLGVGPCIGTKLFSGLFARMKYKDDEAKQLAKDASCATKYLQPQQLLVGIAMVARGEFAYLVAETAQVTPYAGGDEGDTMMSPDVYAATVWALVWATITAPLMFRWALGVFDRATAVHRSQFIGGEDANFQKKAFVIRLAGKYTPGVQREIFNALHGSGVDVLDANITSVRKDDTADADIEMFIDTFTVLSRGKKKDFDDEKLEEMHHHFSEILNDADAQIIFAPPVDVPNKDGVVEVQIIGEHHPSLLHQITDELSSMGLDVIKAHIDQSLQPKGHVDHKDKKENSAVSETSMSMEQINPELLGGGASANAKDAAPVRRGSLGGRRASLGDIGRLATKAALSHVIYKSTTRDSTGGEEGAQNHHKSVGCETFYMKETEKGKRTDAARRAEIKTKLRTLIKDKHHLHGEVMVRVMHASEMALVHTVPKLSKEQRESAIIVKACGKHHKELLHEMCDFFDDNDLEVLHAEIDQEMGEDIILFWAQRSDSMVISTDQRAEIKDGLTKLYSSHSTRGRIQISSGEDQKRRPSVSAMSLIEQRRQSRERPSREEMAIPTTPTTDSAVAPGSSPSPAGSPLPANPDADKGWGKPIV